MNVPSVDQLRKSAGDGDVAAMTALGLRQLSGDSYTFDPDSGAALLQSAAERGSAQAWAAVAVLRGAGVCQPQSWDGALDALTRAAELGSVPAQKQLLLLSAADTPPAGQWRRLGAAADIAGWLAPPAKRSVCENPRVRSIGGFLSPAVCQWLIGSATGRLHAAQVYDRETGAATLDPSRTNSEVDFNIVETDLILLLVRARIAAVTGMPTAVMELTKILHYAPGQAFAPHYDFIDAAAPGMAEELRLRGQRLVTFLVYLNEAYEGGETDFPAAGVRHRGQPGDALYFANVDRDNQPDRQTLHAGLPPHSGEKWLLSQWIRDRVPVRI